MQYASLRRGSRPGSVTRHCAIPVLAAGWLMLCAFSLCLPRAATAVEIGALYTVEVPLDPRNPDAETAAFATALAQVLVRVTGTTAIVESNQMANLFPNPIRYVTQYRPGPDGTLVVSLEGPAIETVLRQSGAAVWGSDRPLTLVWIAVDRGLGDREIIAADDRENLPQDAAALDRNRLLRERIQDIAAYRGIPIAFPLLDTEDLEIIGFSDLWGGFDERLLQASARYGAESILVGRIRPEEAMEARWTWYHGGARTGWSGDADAAVHQLADALAAAHAVSGRDGAETIRLTISGINSVAAYGRVEQLVAGLRGVESVSIDAVEGDRIVYRVDVRGGVERLQRTLAGSDLLDIAASPIDAARPLRPGDNGVTTRELEFLFRSD